VEGSFENGNEFLRPTKYMEILVPERVTASQEELSVTELGRLILIISSRTQRQAMFRILDTTACLLLAACYNGRTIPESDLLMAILLPSSLFHLTLGGGDPVA
jgi:hypothetical protein